MKKGFTLDTEASTVQRQNDFQQLMGFNSKPVIRSRQFILKHYIASRINNSRLGVHIFICAVVMTAGPPSVSGDKKKLSWKQKRGTSLKVTVGVVSCFENVVNLWVNETSPFQIKAMSVGSTHNSCDKNNLET